MKRNFTLSAALLFLSIATSPLLASVTHVVIFDNGGPDGEVGAAWSDFDQPQQTADDFVLSEGQTITDVHFWGIYAFGNTPTEPDDFTIRIFPDDGGKPAIDPLHEFLVGDIGRTDTGLDDTPSTSGSDIYEYWTIIPDTSLTAGVTHWLSIVNNTAADTDDNWGWSPSSTPGNNFFRNADEIAWTNTTGSELAFNLTGIPEPSALVLGAMGLLSMVSLRRRQAALKY